MSFNIGLSGMRAASKDLNVTGNNIANAGTVGFKQSRAEFADVYASSMGIASNTVGSGVQLSNISQQFSQGNINYTQNALDLAINGEGFFQVSNNGALSYTRAGYFGTDRTGYLVDNFGYRLRGFASDENGNVIPNPGDIRIRTESQDPKPTSQVAQGFNLNSTNTVPVNAAVFDPTDPLSYNSSTATTIYDSQGNPHVMSQYFVKQGEGSWRMHMLIDGAHPQAGLINQAAAVAAVGAADGGPVIAAAITAAGNVSPNNSALEEEIGQIDGSALTPEEALAAVVRLGNATPISLDISFDEFGKLVPLSTDSAARGYAEVEGSGIYDLKQQPADTLDEVNDFWQLNANGTISILPGKWSPSNIDASGVPIANGAVSDGAGIELDFRSATQFASAFAVTSVSQDGYTTGELAGLQIDDTGKIFARYTNGQSMVQGQVLLATFANPQGLTPVGKSQWVQSFESGDPVEGTPRSGTLGALQSGALEDSNVELSDQLVNLIVAQRNYQANAKTIETESAITQTLINMR